MYLYTQPCMDICTFNNHYLNPLLDHLFKEASKTIVLLGDFTLTYYILIHENMLILLWMI